MLNPRTSLGNKSDVNWILLKLSPKLDVIALANVVFPTPRGPERVITSPSEQFIDIFFAKSFNPTRL